MSGNDGRIYRPNKALDRAYRLSRAHQFLDEEWAAIRDFPGYVVSTYGRVYSWRNDEILHGSIDSGGRIRVGLMKIAGQRNEIHSKYVHRLVAEAFCPDPEADEEGRIVAFIDGDPYNLMAENLKWVSKNEKKRGSGGIGKRVRVVETGQIFESKSECARYFRVSTSTVNRILAGVGTIDGSRLELCE